MASRPTLTEAARRAYGMGDLYVVSIPPHPGELRNYLVLYVHEGGEHRATWIGDPRRATKFSREHAVAARRLYAPRSGPRPVLTKRVVREPCGAEAFGLYRCELRLGHGPVHAWTSAAKDEPDGQARVYRWKDGEVPSWHRREDGSFA